MGRARGIAAQLPLRAIKAERPKRQGAAFVAVRDDGAILLRRRPPRGLLGGMLEVPTTDWLPDDDIAPDITAAPFAADWRDLGRVSHVFTHFALTLTVYAAPAPMDLSVDGQWATWSELCALPSVMRKVVALALEEEG